eukprot:GHVU01007085.1.p9 GENE.GHVU01007085.1~~GHVU01007085.1.p9  ORF type:complete len:112 (-),score=15.62 GHVU01007085.1:1147-1482(-)
MCVCVCVSVHAYVCVRAQVGACTYICVSAAACGVCGYRVCAVRCVQRRGVGRSQTKEVTPGRKEKKRRRKTTSAPTPDDGNDAVVVGDAGVDDIAGPQRLRRGKAKTTPKV